MHAGYSKLHRKCPRYNEREGMLTSIQRRFSPATTGDTVKGGNTTAKSGLSGRESPWLASLDRRVHQRTMNDDPDDSHLGTLTVSDFGKSVDTEVRKTHQIEDLDN